MHRQKYMGGFFDLDNNGWQDLVFAGNWSTLFGMREAKETMDNLRKITQCFTSVSAWKESSTC